MKYLFTVLIAFFLVGCNEMTTESIVKKVENGVVLIEDDMGAGKGGIGTGFIIGDNQIVTNNHVIDQPGSLYVYSHNSRKKYPVQVVYKDEIADIAVLRVIDWESFKAKESPTNLTLGDSDDTNVGDKIIVIGHPWGLMWSVSEGIVSSKSRRLGSNPRFVDQVDAHLFQGNSGGPIFNEKGQVVCISNMMLSQEGGSYGFCIPSNLVKKVLYDFNNFGEVRWRAINVSVGLTEDGSSVILKDVEPGGAAGMAGLKQNDKVIQIITPKNHPAGVFPKEPNDMITEMATMKGDDEIIKIVIERNGEKMMFNVKTNYKKSSEYTPDKGK